MTLILLILIILLLFGGGYGYRTGYFANGFYNPIGLILMIVLILLLLGLVLPFAGYRWYPY